MKFLVCYQFTIWGPGFLNRQETVSEFSWYLKKSIPELSTDTLQSLATFEHMVIPFFFKKIAFIYPIFIKCFFFELYYYSIADNNSSVYLFFIKFLFFYDFFTIDIWSYIYFIAHILYVNWIFIWWGIFFSGWLYFVVVIGPQISTSEDFAKIDLI